MALARFFQVLGVGTQGIAKNIIFQVRDRFLQDAKIETQLANKKYKELEEFMQLCLKSVGATKAGYEERLSQARVDADKWAKDEVAKLLIHHQGDIIENLAGAFEKVVDLKAYEVCSQVNKVKIQNAIVNMLYDFSKRRGGISVGYIEDQNAVTTDITFGYGSAASTEKTVNFPNEFLKEDALAECLYAAIYSSKPDILRSDYQSVKKPKM